MDKADRLDVTGSARVTGTPRSRRGSAQTATTAELNHRRRPIRRRLDTQALLSRRTLQPENGEYHGSGGVSAENAGRGFAPAFFDAHTATTYLSRFANGQPAPCHILDGLPDDVVLARSASGRVDAVRPGVISGFLFQGRFYSRDEAAKKVAELGQIGRP